MLGREGVDLRLEANCIRFARRGDQIAATAVCGGSDAEVVGSHVLLAVGRVPNTADLGLDKAGQGRTRPDKAGQGRVEVDDRGLIRVDDQLATNMPGIWALGDSNGNVAFTHTSYNDHEIVAANLLDDDPWRVSDRIVCYGLFVDPPLGRVGMTEQQARASGRRVLVGKRMMANVGRAKELLESPGPRVLSWREDCFHPWCRHVDAAAALEARRYCACRDARRATARPCPVAAPPR